MLGSLLILQGCQSLPQTEQLINSPPDDVARQADISSLPFYPQQEYFCGPTTLSEVFNYYGHNVSPDNLAPDTFIPAKQGTLQIEMLAATRQQGLLAYSSRSDMTQLVQLINEGKPIIVLQNLSIEWFPMWHYAVVKGYDLDAQEFILHTGVTPDHRMSYELFERTWQRAKYWMLSAVPAGDTSKYFEPFIYINAAHDLLTVGQSEAAIASLKAATQQWPDAWLAYFLLANHYLGQDLNQSLNWFSQGYAVAEQQAMYLNNYAYALSLAGCQQRAKEMIEQALKLAPQDDNLIDTKRQIDSGELVPIEMSGYCSLNGD